MAINLLNEIKFEKRAEDTVLMHNGVTVGVYLVPAAEDRGGLIHAALRGREGVNESAGFADENRARAWLVGKYLIDASLRGTPPPVVNE